MKTLKQVASATLRARTYTISHGISLIKIIARTVITRTTRAQAIDIEWKVSAIVKGSHRDDNDPITGKFTDLCVSIR